MPPKGIWISSSRQDPVSETTPNTSGEAAGTSPGAILKRCREYHEISLDEAAEATKIGTSYLKALEEDQTREFANLAYLKGFLRIYATYLGLNPDDMTRMYDKLYGIREQEDAATGHAGEPRPRRRISLRALALPLALLGLVLFTSLFVRRTTTGPAPQPPATPPAAATAVQPRISSAAPAPRPEKASETPAETPRPAPALQQPATPPDQASTPRRPAETAKGSFILKLKVTQNGTLSAAIDDSASQPYELTVGDVIEWKAERHISLDLSNAGGVEAELNGKPLKVLGPGGKPGLVTIEADGVKP